MSNHILILEQDDTIRAATVTVLTDCGYTVTAVDTSAEAFELVWKSCDLAIVDLDWPEVAAGDVIRRLQAIDAQTLVVKVDDKESKDIEFTFEEE